MIKFVSDLRLTGQWFSPGPPVSSTNKTNRNDITEILWKVALDSIELTNLSPTFLSTDLNIVQTVILGGGRGCSCTIQLK